MQTIRGEWEDEGQIYRDELVRVFVDIEDTAENRRFFREFRNRLKTRFRQLQTSVKRAFSAQNSRRPNSPELSAARRRAG